MAEEVVGLTVEQCIEISKQDDYEKFLIRGEKGNVVDMDYSGIAEYIAKEMSILVTSTGAVYNYVDGIYGLDKGKWIERKCNTMFKSNATIRRQKEVVNQILNTPSLLLDTHITANAPRNLICFNNGVLNVDTMEFGDHSPEYYFTYKLAVDYDPEATCPTITKTMKKIFGDMAEDELEWLGFILSRGNWLSVISFYLGEGANGKSTWFNLVRRFVGGALCSSISPHQLSDYSHSTAHLIGKIINMDADIGDGAIKKIEVLKKLSGNDPITVNPKGMPMVDIEPETKQMYGSNDLPIITDNSFASGRRLRLVHCRGKFTSKDKDYDPHIGEKLNSPSELSGLANLCVAALINLRKRGKFLSMDESVAEKYDRQSKSSDYFITECMEVTNDPLDILFAADIPKIYNAWCKASSVVPKTEQTMKADIKKRIYGKYKIDRTRIRKTGTRQGFVYVGIRLIVDEEDFELSDTKREINECYDWLVTNHLPLENEYGNKKELRKIAISKFGEEILEEAWIGFMEYVEED